MARVTVEDCAEIVPSRFELVALAAERAKTLSAGGEITIDRKNDKDGVIALREIAGGTISIDQLRECLIQSCQEKVNVDQYGVEEITDNPDSSEISVANEAMDELASMQPNNTTTPIDEDEDSLYGDEDLDVND